MRLRSMGRAKSTSSGQKLWQKARNVVSALGAFKSYSKVDLTNGGAAGTHEGRGAAEQPSPRKSSKKGWIALSACLLLLVVVVVATVVGVEVSKKNHDSSGGAVSANSVTAICSSTL